MEPNYKEFCSEIYEKTYQAEQIRLQYNLLAISKRGKIPESKLKDMETQAQKEAIKQTTIETIRRFPTVEAVLIWKAVYEIHVHRKSGIDDADTIAKVISADQSWKKSSGHAFEEIIKYLGTAALKNSIHVSLCESAAGTEQSMGFHAVAVSRQAHIRLLADDRSGSPLRLR